MLLFHGQVTNITPTDAVNAHKYPEIGIYHLANLGRLAWKNTGRANTRRDTANERSEVRVQR